MRTESAEMCAVPTSTIRVLSASWITVTDGSHSGERARAAMLAAGAAAAVAGRTASQPPFEPHRSGLPSSAAAAAAPIERRERCGGACVSSAVAPHGPASAKSSNGLNSRAILGRAKRQLRAERPAQGRPKSIPECA